MSNHLKVGFLLLIVFLLQACAATTPASVTPYLNRTYYLSNTMYFTTTRSMGAESSELVHPGHHVGIGYIAPSISEYQTNPASRQYSLLGTNSTIDGIVSAGTPFVLTEFSQTAVEGYLHTKILIKSGRFAGKLASIDEDTLLKSMHLKKIKKDASYSKMGKTYHREVMVSPFSQ